MTHIRRDIHDKVNGGVHISIPSPPTHTQGTGSCNCPAGRPPKENGGGLGDKKELSAMGRCAKEKFDFYFVYSSVIYAYAIRKYTFSILKRVTYF